MKIIIFILSLAVIILFSLVFKLILTVIDFENYEKNSIEIMEKMYEMLDSNTRKIGRINNILKEKMEDKE